MAIPLFNIGGLASGFDTNSITSSVLDVERIPIQQLEARRADHQVEDNAWQSTKTRYSAIRTALNALDSEGDLDKFATATSSNKSAVAVSTTGAATPGSISFTVNRRNHPRTACRLNQRIGHWGIGLGDLRRWHRLQAGALVG